MASPNFLRETLAGFRTQLEDMAQDPELMRRPTAFPLILGGLGLSLAGGMVAGVGEVVEAVTNRNLPTEYLGTSLFGAGILAMSIGSLVDMWPKPAEGQSHES